MSKARTATMLDCLKTWRRETKLNTVGSLEAFLAIVDRRSAKNAAIPQSELEASVDIHSATAGMYVKQLSQRGLGLIQVERNPENWRENLLSLTAKGEKLARDLGAM